MCDRIVYSKKTQAAIDRLEHQIRELADRQVELTRQIVALKCGESPIVVGQHIEWESGHPMHPRRRRGLVTAITPTWSGYEYRVTLLSRDGREVGIATVRTDQLPVIEGADE